jgi:hypothetical protein
MSHRVHTLAAALVLAVLGCSGNDPAQPIVPTPPTTDELIIADCYEIQAALESFAAAHGGAYPSRWQDIDTLETNLLRPNRYTGFETEPRFNQAYWPGQIGVMLYYEVDGSYDVHGYRIEGRGAHGILITVENIAGVSQEALDAYATLLEEVLIVEAAARQFFEEAGMMPADTGGDTTPLGNTLVDFLPGGRLLVDPLSGYRLNPVEGSASAPGNIGYSPWDPDLFWRWTGYMIDAVGPYSVDPIAIRRPYSDEDRWTHGKLLLLHYAVESFVTLSGRYPNNVDLDETPSGDTVLELIPHPLTNVYTGTVMTPRNGLATLPGEIGYVPVVEDDVVAGYIINGFGIVAEFHRIEVLP